MRQKFSGAEAVHEILIDVELHVSDTVADVTDFLVVSV